MPQSQAAVSGVGELLDLKINDLRAAAAAAPTPEAAAPPPAAPPAKPTEAPAKP